MSDISLSTVGIVLPDARTPTLFRRALESILNQSHTDWRLVVFDTGDLPGEVERVARLVLPHEDSRISFRRADGAGHADCVNRGIEELETDLAIIHSESDSWAPDFLAVMLQTHMAQSRKLPGLKGIVSGVSSVEESVTGNHIRIESVADWHPPGVENDQTDGVLDIRRIVIANPFPAIAFLFDRAEAVSLGLYDPTLPILAEWDFHQRFCLKHDVWIHAERLAFHHAKADRTDPLDEAAYGALLTNRWVRREGKAGLGTLQILQVLGHTDPAPAASQPRPATELEKRPARPVSGKPRKGPIARLLSSVNRRRKRWI